MNLSATHLETGRRADTETDTRELAIQVTLFLLRVVLGFLFLQHGGMKLFGWFGGMPKDMFPSGTVPLMSQMGLAGILEFVGGLLLVIGLGTRLTAFILSGEMAVAYFQGTSRKEPGPFKTMANLQYCCALSSFTWRPAAQATGVSIP